jgi:hypothetical protein
MDEFRTFLQLSQERFIDVSVSNRYMKLKNEFIVGPADVHTIISESVQKPHTIESIPVYDDGGSLKGYHFTTLLVRGLKE